MAKPKSWSRQSRPYHRKCTACGTPFEAIRKDANYCSPKCRQTAKRKGIVKKCPKTVTYRCSACGEWGEGWELAMCKQCGCWLDTPAARAARET